MRIILREGVTHDELDDALVGLGCRLINVVPVSAQNPMQLVFSTPDRRSLVFVVEDLRLGVGYLAGQGPGVEAHLEAILAEIPHLTIEEIERRLAVDGDLTALSRALGALVLAVQGAPTEGQLQHLRRGLRHGDATVRSAALLACSYVLWEGLRADIEQRAAAEPDPLVRRQALQALELYAAGSLGR